MTEYNTELETVGSEFERRTADCPVCGSTVREMRNEDKWLCDGCARYWKPDEIDT